MLRICSLILWFGGTKLITKLFLNFLLINFLPVACFQDVKFKFKVGFNTIFILSAAPEILRGCAYGPEVDMWSVGIITYIL